jgi:ADP-ribosyltransferase exoenzyme
MGEWGGNHNPTGHNQYGPPWRHKTLKSGTIISTGPKSSGVEHPVLKKSAAKKEVPGSVGHAAQQAKGKIYNAKPIQMSPQKVAAKKVAAKKAVAAKKVAAPPPAKKVAAKKTVAQKQAMSEATYEASMPETGSHVSIMGQSYKVTKVDPETYKATVTAPDGTTKTYNVATIKSLQKQQAGTPASKPPAAPPVQAPVAALPNGLKVGHRVETPTGWAGVVAGPGEAPGTVMVTPAHLPAGSKPVQLNSKILRVTEAGPGSAPAPSPPAAVVAGSHVSMLGNSYTVTKVNPQTGKTYVMGEDGKVESFNTSLVATLQKNQAAQKAAAPPPAAPAAPTATKTTVGAQVTTKSGVSGKVVSSKRAANGTMYVTIESAGGKKATYPSYSVNSPAPDVSIKPKKAAYVTPPPPKKSSVPLTSEGKVDLPALTRIHYPSSAESGFVIPDFNTNLTPGWTPKGKQKSGPYAYSGGSYTAINNHLRRDTHLSPTNRENIAGMDAAFAEVPPLTQSIVLGRKMKGNGPFPQNPPPMEPGAVFTDKGFVSTSKDPGVWYGDVHMEIRVPAGKKALDLNHTTGSQHPSEKEVVLPRNSKFRVISDTHSPGKRRIVVEVI